MLVDPSALPALTINLEHGDTDHETCRSLPVELFEIMTAPDPDYPGYGSTEVNVAINVLPDNIEAGWWSLPSSHSMRKKINRARRAGYSFEAFPWNERLDEIHAINHSMPTRQGRPMTDEYLRYPAPIEQRIDQPCPRHHRRCFGVFRDDRLYAYLRTAQVGEAAMTYKLLGHGDHLDDGIMFLLLFEAGKWHQEYGSAAYWCYHLQDAGTAGLREFKAAMGFVGHTVRWRLSGPRANG